MNSSCCSFFFLLLLTAAVVPSSRAFSLAPLRSSSSPTATSRRTRYAPTLLWADADVNGSEQPEAAATTPPVGETPPAVETPAAPVVASAASTTEAASTPDAAAPKEEVSTYVKCGNCEATYLITEAMLGGGRGRRLQCTVCSHSWFQSKDRLQSMREGFELVPLPEQDKERIQTNMEQGKSAKFMGNCKLYVGNIAFECSEAELAELFGQYGGVGDVALVRDDQGRNRGFGFITMREEADGKKAIDELDGISVRGRSLAVRESTKS